MKIEPHTFKVIALIPLAKRRRISKMPLLISTYYDECPCCSNWSVKVSNNTIVRHEKGLGYVPYRIYHKMEKTPEGVRAMAKRNLCPASGKSIEEARAFHANHDTKTEEKTC